MYMIIYRRSAEERELLLITLNISKNEADRLARELRNDGLVYDAWAEEA